MAAQPKPVRSALMDALQELSQDDLKRFIKELLARKVEGQPRVPRNKVDGKDYMDVADVVVSTFTEKNAVNVAVEILKRINGEVADTLVEETGGQTSQSASTDDMHFVDKHRGALIQRVSNIDSILDDLLERKVINQETYTKIRVIATPQDQMRKLYEGPLKAAEACKEIFYQILQKHEEFLIEDLKGKK
ncbi:apoptosis-associated speck-like protein containing a CARD [Acanthochromis polyacanthus]|uniref:PYD and CARD domain containing n=1 Tax=Acanthochromis polyacanthus TaxID=80966 RepID=A0A3Q1F3P7_9TELE|nr:apoptosis-associated speck-like protein containing a CARD [Acanthochromis polyacanthus]